MRDLRFAAVLPGARLHVQTNSVPLLNNPLVPSSVTPGSGGFTLTINGTGSSRTRPSIGTGAPPRDRLRCCRGRGWRDAPGCQLAEYVLSSDPTTIYPPALSYTIPTIVAPVFPTKLP